MEQRSEQLRSTAEDCERKDDPAGALAARQQGARWMFKADAAGSQLHEVGKVLEYKRSALVGCEREAPGLLRGEEQQGGKLTATVPSVQLATLCAWHLLNSTMHALGKNF